MIITNKTTIKDNFKKGAVEMLLLQLLSEEDLYGYQMAQLIIEKGGGYITVPEGSLYPTLYKLQDKNCISSHTKLIGKRLRRVYYHIEDDGQAYLQELKKEYYAVNNCITNILEYPKEGTDKKND